MPQTGNHGIRISPFSKHHGSRSRKRPGQHTGEPKISLFLKIPWKANKCARPGIPKTGYFWKHHERHPGVPGGKMRPQKETRKDHPNTLSENRCFQKHHQTLFYRKHRGHLFRCGGGQAENKAEKKLKNSHLNLSLKNQGRSYRYGLKIILRNRSQTFPCVRAGTF